MAVHARTRSGLTGAASVRYNSGVNQTASAVQIRVNGEDLTIDMPATVANVVERRKPRPPFAVELNKQLVKRGAYESTSLTDGDVVEIVTLVGGG